MITKNGICYDLSTSPYVLDVDGYSFHFSSPSHLSKFRNGYQVKQDWLTDSLTRRFVFGIDASTLALFHFYRQVETRGFYVVDSSGLEHTCPENLKFGGLLPRESA